MQNKIRKMSRDDIDVVVDIIREHEEMDGDCSGEYYRGYFGDSGRIESAREENFVALDSATGEVIGVCGFSPDKYDTPRILWLNWFYLSKKFHGRGIGAGLLKYTLDRIAEQNINKVYLDTSSYPIYARAIKLYKDFGFEIEGDFIDYFDKGENCVIMGLDLKKYRERNRKPD